MSHGEKSQDATNVFHVMCRGVGRQIIFEDDADRRYLLDRLKSAKRERNVLIHAWCLMDNHIHLLIDAEPRVLAAFMQRVLSEYAMYFNRRHDRVGHLFQDRYGRKAIDTEAYLLEVVRYIHQNPLEYGFTNLAAYRWSSYREYLGVGEPTITDMEVVLDLFGSYNELVRFHGEKSRGAFLGNSTSRGDVGMTCAMFVALDEVGEEVLHSLKSLPRKARDGYLARLLQRGLTVRQIERLTGVSRGVVARVSAQQKS